MDLRSQLIRDEGEIPYAYQDSEGYWTIGVGHLIDKRKGGGLPKEIIDALLDWDIRQKTIEVTQAFPWATKLDPVRFAALTNMCFQLGTEGVKKFRNMLSALEAGRYSEVKAHALDSLWAKQTPDRAERVATQLATGVWV